MFCKPQTSEPWYHPGKHSGQMTQKTSVTPLKMKHQDVIGKELDMENKRD